MQSADILPTLPTEIIVEIAKCHWRAWSKLRIACTQLRKALSALNPYELFTWVHVVDWEDCFTTKHWMTIDGTYIRSIEVMLCGMTTISYRDRKYMKYDYGSTPYIDEDDNYHMGDFTHNITTYGQWGDETTEYVSKAEWHRLRQPWIDIFNAV